jgi:hypothetical protein
MLLFHPELRGLQGSERLVVSVDDPRPLAAAATLLQQRFGWTGRFAVVETAGVFHVVPTEIRDRTGAHSPQRSVLATAVFLPERERSTLEFVEDVLNEVEAASKQIVRTGSIPVNLMRRRTRAAVNGDTAGAVLARVLTTEETRLSWQLLYGADTRVYSLNLSIVPSP